ncbi:MAG: flavodoxin family protein [Candidatus Thorarchaeota archaeon]
MLIVGICGSPKKERSNTHLLLQHALEAASQYHSETMDECSTLLLDISDFDIRHCTGCDTCVRKKPCPESEHDDMPKIEEKLSQANGIIIAAPSYFTSVPGVLKDFIDRSRYMKMQDHQLKDKLFGAITYAGLRYGGQEHVIDILNRYAIAQGMIVIGGIGNPVKDGTFGSGALQTDDGSWRSAKDDELAIRGSQKLGARMAELLQRFQ